MTLTIKPVTAAIMIALIGILAGLALGQITQANSAKNHATASAAMTARQGSQILRELKRQSREIKNLNSNVVTIGRILGTSKYSSGSIHSTLNDVKKNTGKVCAEIGGFLCDQYSAKVEKPALNP